MCRIRFLLLYILFIGINSYAQIDNEFWFVAPEVTKDHGDSPIIFRISTLNQPAKVTISQPANSGFTPISFNVSANTMHSEVMTVNDAENRPANTVNNKGFLITSDVDITVYYEVNHTNNPDKFTLKGNNALGSEFYVVSQDLYKNHNYSTPAREHVDIVATEDNTKVTILPTANATGHTAGTPFTITLNRGQTYSLEAVSESASSSFAGTHITSDKPIAVTISDDSIEENVSSPSAWDLIGDQLIPTNIIGTEYIAVRTHDKNYNKKGQLKEFQKVFILAVEDNTVVMFDGDPSKIVVLDQGEMIDETIINQSLLIEADKPIYVYQITSLNKEIGSAILPHITCTGSQSVSFQRNLTDAFYVQLATQSDNRNNFSLIDESGNSQSFSISWEVVPGTNNGAPEDTWYAASVDLASIVSTGTSYRMVNSTGLFHMGILDENGSSLNFGYFSAYSNLNISGITQSCYGNTIQLDAGDRVNSYAWYSSLTGSNIISTSQTINVTETATYWVTAEMNLGGCQQTDSVDVVFNLPVFDLGEDTTLCDGESINVAAPAGFSSYLWDNGSSSGSRNVTAIGNIDTEIWLEVSDDQGCTGQDTMTISGFPAPVLSIAATQNICLGDTIFDNSNMTKYQWQIGSNPVNPADTLPYFVPGVSGIYYLTGWNEFGCSITQDINVTVNNAVNISLNNISACPNTSHTFTLPGGLSSYLWSNGSTVNSSTYNSPTTVWATVVDNNGCTSSDTAVFDWNQVTSVPSSVVRECRFYDLTLSANNAIINNYSWFFDNGIDPVADLGNNNKNLNLNYITAADQGLYIINGTDVNGCSTIDTIELVVLPVPDVDLGNDAAICDGDSIKIQFSDLNLFNYKWSTSGNPNLSTDESIWIKDPDTYYLEAEVVNGCFAYDTIQLTVNPLPNVSINDDIGCKNTSKTFNAGSFVSYLWSTGQTGNQITVNKPSSVWVEVTDGNGCVNRDNATWSWYKEIYVSARDTGVCSGEDITLEVDNTLSNIQWYLNGASLGYNLPTYQIIGAGVGNQGSYVITADDINGCSVSDTLQLTVGTTPPLNLGADRNMCMGDSIRVDVTQGFKSYQWTKGVNPTIYTTPYLIVTGSEEVRLTAIHSNGCSQSDTLVVTALANPSVDLGPDLIVCPETPLINLYENISYNSNSGTPNSDRFVWAPLGTTLIGVTDSLKVSTTGIYSLVVYNNNFADGKFCSDLDTIEVSYYDVEPVKLNTQAICTNDYIDLQVPSSYPVPPAQFNYRWFYIDSFNNEIPGPVNSPFNTTNAGYYILEIENNINSCVVRDTMYLANKPLEDVGISSDASICSGDSVRLYGNKGLQYVWSTMSNPNLSTNYEIWVSTQDEYYLTVIGKNGCDNTDTANVTVNGLPIVTLSPVSPVCVGSSATINISGVTASDGVTPIVPQSINWSTGTFNDVDSLVVNDIGTYGVTIVDANGCSDEASVSLINYPVTAIGLNETTGMCEQSTIALNSPLIPGIDIQQYQWFRESIGSLDRGVINTPWNIDVPGRYILSVTDNNGCLNSDSTDVILISIPDFTLGPDRGICMGDSITISPEDDYVSYMWNDNPVDNLPFKIVTGSQTHKLTVSNTNGCLNSDTIIVTANLLPVVDLGPDVTVCTNYKVTLDAGAGFTNYSWSTGETSQTIVAKLGTYRVNVTDVNGCSNSDNMTVSWYPIPDVNIGRDTTICSLDELILDAGVGFNSYLWHDGSVSQTTIAIFSDLNEVFVTDANGCVGWDSRLVKAFPEPEVHLGPDTTICATDSVTLHAGTNFIEYLWNDGSTDSVYLASETGLHWVGVYDGCLWARDTVEIYNHPSPVVASVDTIVFARVTIFADDGTPPYQYQLGDGPVQSSNTFTGVDAGEHWITVIDVNGCYALDTVILSLDIGDITVPNFFTPNGDGYNDVWGIEGVEEKFPESTVDIFDRYGKQLITLKAEDLNWNGEYHNNPVPSDDYWFVLHLISDKKTYRIYKGHFTLKR